MNCMTADRTGLLEPGQVDTVQSMLMSALKTHCSGRLRAQGGVMVGRLLGILVELRSVGGLAADLLRWRLQTTSDAHELTTLTRVVSVLDEHTVARHMNTFT